jgi:hypothetical protein
MATNDVPSHIIVFDHLSCIRHTDDEPGNAESLNFTSRNNTAMHNQSLKDLSKLVNEECEWKTFVTDN